MWRTDGQEPSQRTSHAVIEEIVELRRMGFRFIALADDNFYPVTLEDIRMAKRRADPARLLELEALRAERFELMAGLAKLPSDTVFFTQITMEAAEDPSFLQAMNDARIKGELKYLNEQVAFSLVEVGFQSVSPTVRPTKRSRSRFYWINQVGIEQMLLRRRTPRFFATAW